MELNTELKLKSNDNKEFKISRKNAELSGLVKNIIQDFGDGDLSEAINISEVDSHIMELIIEYLNHYAGKAPPEMQRPLKSANLADVFDDWSDKFIAKLNIDDILDISSAANFMEIQSLLDLALAKVACMCKDKAPDEIFGVFGLKKEDISKEEVAKIKEENPWMETDII